MRKAINVYVLATQLISTLVVLSVAGIFIGRHLDPQGPLDAILAGVGLIVGLFIDLIFIFQFLRFQSRNEKDEVKEDDYES